MGGELKSNKGINVRGGGLSASALTEKDIQDLEYGCKLGADYIALSFVKQAQDIHFAKELIQSHGGHAGVIAKIERKEALDQLDSIIAASDGVMVARGDLALEIGDAQVPLVQKQILAKARKLIKPVIIATQMMESMITNKVPTRAETSDCANATLDGCDAVMLSAETAIGEHPQEVIQVVARTCMTVERSAWWGQSNTDEMPSEMTDSRPGMIAWSAAQMAMQQPVSALVPITESGLTALRMSRFRINLPIFAVCSNQIGLGRMSLFRGVYPIYSNFSKMQSYQLPDHVLQLLVDKKLILDSEYVVVTKGDVVGSPGETNSIKIISLVQRKELV